MDPTPGREPRPREKEVLAGIADLQRQIIAGKLAPQDALKAIVERVCDFTGATGAAIALAEGQEVHYKAGVGDLAGIAARRIKMAAALPAQSLRKSKVIACDDLEELDFPLDLVNARHSGARSFLAVPVLQRGEAVAAIEAVSTVPNAFLPDHVRALQLLAQLVCLVLGRTGALAAHPDMESDRAAIQDAVTALTAIYDHLRTTGAVDRSGDSAGKSDASLNTIKTALAQLRRLAASRGMHVAPQEGSSDPDGIPVDTAEYFSDPEEFLQRVTGNARPPSGESEDAPVNPSFQKKLGNFILRQTEEITDADDANGNSGPSNNNQNPAKNIRTDQEH